MSPIGRVFVALNFGLSCAFLAFTAFYLQNADSYKSQFDAEAAAHTTDNTNNEARITKLTSDNTNLDRERGSLASEVQDLTTNLTAAKDRNDDLNKKVNSMDASLKAIVGTNTNIATTLKEQSDLIEERTAKWLDAIQVKDEAVTQRDNMQDALTSVKGQLARLREANDALLMEGKMAAAKIENLETTLEIAVRKVPDLASIIVGGLPMVEGKVVSVNASLGTVVLNLGDNQAKVSNGWTFALYQGGKYKGECQVVDVTKNACYARVTSKVPGAVIASGDSVKTRF